MDSKPDMTFYARALVEHHKQTILSMRRHLTEKKLIMRASYKGYSFHTYSAKEFQRKASNYIKQSIIYKFINEVNQVNPEVSRKCLNNIVQEVDTTLNMLLHSKSITNRQHVLMHPKRSMIQLNYLYFVPDTYEVCFVSFYLFFH